MSSTPPIKPSNASPAATSVANGTAIPWLTPAVLFSLAVVLLVWWQASRPSQSFALRVPGSDRDGSAAGGSAATEKWTGRLIAGPGKAANIPGEWPQFRGPRRDGISAETIPLARQWPEPGPKAIWRIPVGEGYAGAAIWQGRVYVVDYDQPNQSDAIRCLSLADGQEIWRYTYPVKVKRDHGMSRTVPTIAAPYLLTLGPKCHLVCLDAASGELRWQTNLVAAFGTEVPPWYAGQCPFVDGDRVILGTGGDAVVAALELATGKLIWKSTNPQGWQMTHSSIAVLNHPRRRQYVYCASGGVAGVAADTGELLWQTTDWKISIANVPTPLELSNERLFLSGGYNAGALILRVRAEEDRFAAESVLRLKPALFGATQQTPILHEQHIYGVRPDGQFVCLNLEGQSVWTSGANDRFGNGPFMMAHGLFYLLNDSGLLTLAEADPSGYKRLAQAKILQGHDSWAPLALVAGRLIARDLTEMVCLDVAAPN